MSQNFQLQAFGCPLCTELRTGLIDAKYQAYTDLRRRCKREAGNVVAIPSVSPLRHGHVLLVPVPHISAWSHADAESQRGLVAAVREVASRVCGPGVEPLLFEHGVGRGLRGGCGIEHAHIHLLPVRQRERLKAETSFEARFSLQNAGDLADALAAVPPDASYGLIGRPDGLRIAVAELPSQTLRRCVAAAIDSPSTDWRDLESWDVMEETFAALAA